MNSKESSSMTQFLLFIFSFALILTQLSAEPPTSLLSNGDFQMGKEGSQHPLDWKLGKDTTWEQEGENRFLRLTSSKPGQTITLYRRIYIKQPVEALSLSFKVRHEKLNRGKAGWHNGKVVINFRGANDKKLGSTPAPSFQGEQKMWKAVKKDFLVPKGTQYLEFMPSLFQVKSGAIDFDDFSLIPTDPLVIHAAIEKREQEKLAEVSRRAALVKPQVPVADPANYPDELKVSGNVLVSKKTGRMVWLQGVSIASLEWSAAGEQILKSLEVAINDWKSNCIRLPVKEDFYNGTGKWQSDGGAGYRQLVDDAVNYCADHGVYIVIDLHRYRAPTQAHLDFWTIVATKYKNHPAVLFDLLNEPHTISWDVWRNGGMVGDKKSSKPDVAIENNEKLKKGFSIGMQPLLDGLRKTGAKNVVIVGALDWAYDLSGILKGFAIDDPQGNGVVYSTHVYPWKKDWQKMFMDVAAKHPLFVGEVGCEIKLMPWQKTTEDPKTWAPDMIGLIQDLKLNWTAWCFHPSSSPRILMDWDYTPTPFWGTYVKDALGGKIFPRGKLR